ncbi:50S ribosomal protein L17 [Tessaracoccus sp. OS52]|uniref:50S ribosomal protein L17 n=1 Tax=Tessaracoccus sp. OS52 TaxID=2886691 RepID=UPI001D0F7EBA|nr:50S ribosomal protein L17 [Tessaracoccus sp. OS52]MCC2592234.1 50S ribosomal protein L17 [Tessaracoccus sp. OS52]
MPKPTKGPRLGGSPTHQRIILRNLATQLFEHGRVTTTETKARRVQPLAEKLITKAKRGDLASRRLVLQSVTSQEVVHKLFAEIAPALEGREGGYTRVTKIGPRKGDNAPMAIIEIVTESVEESRASRSKAPRAAKAEPAAGKGKQAKAAAPADEEQVVEESAVDEAEEAKSADVAEEDTEANAEAAESGVAESATQLGDAEDSEVASQEK